MRPRRKGNPQRVRKIFERILPAIITARNCPLPPYGISSVQWLAARKVETSSGTFRVYEDVVSEVPFFPGGLKLKRLWSKSPRRRF